MAKLVRLNDYRVQCVVAKNIGFLKAAKDVLAGGSELVGIEELYVEAFKEASGIVPDGYYISNSELQIIKELNVIVIVTADKLM